MTRLARTARATLLLAFLSSAAPMVASAQLLSLDLDLSLGGILSDIVPDIEIELPLGIGIGISLGSDSGEPPAAGGGGGGGGGGAGGTPNQTNVVVPMPQAVQAVNQQRAIPLNDLLRIVPRYVDGQVIDVALVFVQNSLYYQVKLLNRAGVVFQTYFDAATGVPVAF